MEAETGVATVPGVAVTFLFLSGHGPRMLASQARHFLRLLQISIINRLKIMHPALSVGQPGLLRILRIDRIAIGL